MPKPAWPEASVKRFICGLRVTLGSRIFCLPFHKGRNDNHQLISSLASEFKEIWCDSLSTVVDKLMRRRKNVLPEGVIFEANDNLPIRDESFRFVIFFLAL